MNIYKAVLLGAALTVSAMCAASAQTTTTTTPTATSTGNATVTTNVTAVSAFPGSATNGSAGAVAGGGDYTTHTKQSGTLYTTPSVAGSYFSGANPCLIGIGGGAAGGPIGFSISFGRNDEGCQRRSDAAAWHALGFDNVAIARLCQDEDNRKAFEATGNLCPNSYRTAITAPAIPPVAAQPVSAQPVVAQAAPPPAPSKPHRQVPDWCATAGTSGKMSAAYIQYMCGD